MTTTAPIKSPAKLIEVALPLDLINDACAKEKQPGIGAHPRGLHLWWARRPQAAARAVIFAQLVNDPGYQQGAGFKYGRNRKDAERERQRLFQIIEELVLWGNRDNEELLDRARAEIMRSWREVCELNKDHPRAKELFDPKEHPGFHDPFAGGGALPLEAQRLGLDSLASDLNPVAVLINKAMIEVPARFSGRPPVMLNHAHRNSLIPRSWSGPEGLAEDLGFYGEYVREQVEKRIGHLYPPVEVTQQMVAERPDLGKYSGKRLNVVAWLWARTVKSPNPAFSHIDVPLASTFILSAKEGKEAYVEPVIDETGCRFVVRPGRPADPTAAKRGTSAGKWNAFRCAVSDTPITYDYIRAEGTAGRLGMSCMAVVAEGVRGKVYLTPPPQTDAIARSAAPSWRPELEINYHPRDIKTQIYGLLRYGDLFTARQLTALSAFSDAIQELRERVLRDAVNAGMADDGVSLDKGGAGAAAYADAILLYLALAIDRLADYNSSLATWKPSGEQVMQTYKRQALPMTWDFPESNVLGSSAICWKNAVKYTAENLLAAASCAPALGRAIQADAATQTLSNLRVVSTDPPYYDNIGYADLSDFFYVWLRRSLRPVFPQLFATLAVPKAEELVATPYRHGTKEKAEAFFLEGMTRAMSRLAENAHPAFPVTIYYAFKQSESTAADGTTSTGWDTFLAAVIASGFAISGTWPVRTELENKVAGGVNNMLASSIVLVCRKRGADAGMISRRDFLRELNHALPTALDEMTRGAGGEHSPVAPVDLSQAIIGPGMAVFSKYTAVIEADGSQMSVRTALQLINRFLAEDDFDHDTQFCLHWFGQHGWGDGAYGEADVLARAKATAVSGVTEAGVAVSGGGKVRLRKWTEYPDNWDPRHDMRLPVWEALHHLIRAFRRNGESGAGTLLGAIKSKTEAIRQLAYRLYTQCERRGWAEDARNYNELVTSWPAIEAAANAIPETEAQLGLFGGKK